jgi:hypothetical protein
MRSNILYQVSVAFSLGVAACGGTVVVPGSTGTGGNDTSTTGSTTTGTGGGLSASSSAGTGVTAGVCTPGMDHTCNYLQGLPALAGTCNPDGTCTCNPGFNLVADISVGAGLCIDPTACDPMPGGTGCDGNDSAPVTKGTCNPDGTCTCLPGFVLDDSGRCISAVCHGGCPVEGEMRCAGTFLQTCIGPANGCAHHWLTTDHCLAGGICNSDATKCVAQAGSCGVDAECGCGCSCKPGGGFCVCTGAVPPSCAVDKDCGPVCAGLICTAGKCEQASSHP